MQLDALKLIPHNIYHKYIYTQNGCYESYLCLIHDELILRPDN